MWTRMEDPMEFNIDYDLAAIDLEKLGDELQQNVKKYEAELAKISSNERLSEVGKAKATKAAHTAFSNKAIDLKDRGEAIARPLLDLCRQKVQNELDRDRFEPVTIEEWQEAAARGGFVKEDVEAWVKIDPVMITEAFQEALEIDDKILAWLLARHGRRVLDSMEDEVAIDALVKLETARCEADPRNEEKLAREREKRRRLGGLLDRLFIVTPDEEQEIRDTFKLRR
jgi:predicted transcriptional regulator